MSTTPEYRDAERLDLPSASKMHVVVNCPGQPNLERKLPTEAFKKKEEAEEDEWAASGTRVHNAFETGNTLELDAEEVETYKQGVKYEEMIVDKWMADKNIEECEEGPRELRIFIIDPNNWPEPIGSVKMDRHYYHKERGLLLITDLKSGWNPTLPPSPKSWQLRFAAVAAWREQYPWVKEVRVGYCKAQTEYTVRDFCDYVEQDLIYSWQSIQFHLWESTQEDAPRHAGAHCNYCPCKAYCPEAGALSMLPSVIARSVPRASEMDWETMIQVMPPADLVRIWESSTIIGKILEAVKDRLKAMDPAQLEMLGLGLGKGRKNDSVTNVGGAFMEMVKHFSEQDVLECMDVSMTKVAALRRKEKECSKEAAQKWADALLDPYITRDTSAPPIRKLKE